jgi:hypothetical protein
MASIQGVLRYVLLLVCSENTKGRKEKEMLTVGKDTLSVFSCHIIRGLIETRLM